MRDDFSFCRPETILRESALRELVRELREFHPLHFFSHTNRSQKISRCTKFWYYPVLSDISCCQDAFHATSEKRVYQILKDSLCVDFKIFPFSSPFCFLINIIVNRSSYTKDNILRNFTDIFFIFKVERKQRNRKYVGTRKLKWKKEKIGKIRISKKL